MPDMPYFAPMYTPRFYGYRGGQTRSPIASALQGFNDAGVGDAVAKAISDYHNAHVQHDQALGAVTALQRAVWQDKTTGQPVLNPEMDENGNPVDKNLISPFNKQSIEKFQNFSMQNQAFQKGGMDAMTRVLGAMASQALKNAAKSNDPTTVARTNQANAAALHSVSSAKLADARTKAVLGEIPKPVPPPTAGQILNNQQKQIQTVKKLQDGIADRLGNQSLGGVPVTDPSILLDPNNIQYGSKNMFGAWVPATDPKTAPNVKIFGADPNGKDIVAPANQFQRLQKQAQQWQQYGNQINQLQQGHQAFNDSWSSLTPQQQAVATSRLASNPTPQMKAAFDQKLGAGAADQVLGAVAAQPTTPAPSATPDQTQDQPGDNEPDDQAPPSDDPDAEPEATPVDTSNAGDYGNQ